MTTTSFSLIPTAEAYRALPPTSRIWIYQSKQSLPQEFLPEIKAAVERFAKQWISHNRQLRAFADVLHHRFIILMVDESQADASGCSIDKSVHFLQQLEQAFDIDLFDRMTFAWLEGETVRSADRETFSHLYEQEEINDLTQVFDNLVQTKADFEEKWLKPLQESWHKRMV
jgi:hypothetical protein